MSRILKASYINIDNNNYVAIDNTLNNPQDILDGDINEESNQKEQELLERLRNEILEATREQADQIIQNATNEAQIIIDNANAEIQENSNRIYEESEQQGYQDGFAKAQSDAQALKDEANQVLINANVQKEQILKNIEPDIIELVIDISQKILTDAFTLNPQIISLLIKKGLKNVKEISNMKIIVSNDNFEYISQNKEELLGVDTNKHNIEIIKDLSLDNNDCIIETAFGSINCSVKEQFEGIKEALTYILNSVEY